MSRLRHPWSPVGFTSGAVCSLAVWAEGVIVGSANELLGGSTGSAAGARAATGQGEFPSAVDLIGMRQDDSTSGNSSGRGDVIANWESCATPVASVTTKKRKDPLTTEPRRVLGDVGNVGNHGIAGEGSRPTQKKARRTSQDKPIDETLLFGDDDDDENYTDHENEGSKLDHLMLPLLIPRDGKTKEEGKKKKGKTDYPPRHFTPQKYSSELEAELTKLREEMSKKMLPDDFDSSLAEYKVNLGLDGHMPDAVIDSVLDEGSTHTCCLLCRK